MKKYWILLLLSAIFFSLAGFYFKAKEEKLADLAHVHHHAGFVVYIDNQKQDYSGFEYMSLSPCSTLEIEKTQEEIQLEKAHLHEQVGDVVHVHRAGATWGDLFQNLGVNFDQTKELKAYFEGGESETILGDKIQPYQSVIIVVGDQSMVSEYLTSRVTIDHIKEVEQMSELCGVTN